MLAIALALASSAMWGAADFNAGWFARRLPVLTVLLLVEGAGLAVIVLVVLADRTPLPGGEAALVAAGAGLAGILALGAFYRALAVGTMSLVAPVSAAGVTVPVVVGLATGDALGTVTATGLVLAVAGLLLASRETGEAHGGASREGLGLALLAALGFGLYFLGADRAAEDSVAWSLLISRAAAIPVVAALALARRSALPTRRDGLLVALGGCGDLAATAAFGVALNEGELSVVSVLAALYPVWTVLLARVLLHERLGALQAAGVACALVGVGLVAAGGA